LEIGLFDEEIAPLSPPEHRNWTELSEKERREEALRMQIHAAMVDRVDQNVGRLITKLKTTGEFENTLILFLVDNGSSHERPSRGGKDSKSTWGTVGSFEAIGPSWANATNSPLRKWKVQGLEGGICTPMIAHWPAGITTKPGFIYREPCHLIDLVPTFMQVAGKKAKYPANIPALDGVSLMSTFRGSTLQRKKPLFFQYGSWQVIREKQWKLVQRQSDPWQLYNLAEDRTEIRDLAATMPERVVQMKTQWQEWAKEVDIKVRSNRKLKKKPGK